MTVLISEHNGLYQHDEPGTESKTARQPSTPQRCMVEWVSQEDGNPPSTATSSKTPKDESRPSTPSTDSNARVLTPTAALETSDVSQTDEGGDTVDKGGEVCSPSKQVKAQPSWKSSFKSGTTSAGARGKIGGSTGDVSAGGGGKWRMNGLSSLRAHRRTTSSGEKLKDSNVSLKDSTLSLKETVLRDLQKDSDEDSPQMSHRAVHQSHRLSAYDNVAPSVLSLPTDSSSIWTSFEISLAEPKGSDKSANSGRARDIPAEVRDNANAMDQSGTDTDNAESNEGLANMLTELKQELKKQRTSYEATIRK